MRENRRYAQGFFGGTVLVALGMWFLLSELGFDVPHLGQLWPIFPFLNGFGALLAFFGRARRDPGLIFSGVFCCGIGIFFFLFTFGIFDWSRLGVLWPVFPLIAGLAFTGSWLAGACRETGLVVPAIGGIGVGVIGLFFTLGGMSFENVRLVGSLAIVALGAYIVLQSLRSQRRTG